jgi:hypothetical protein
MLNVQISIEKHSTKLLIICLYNLNQSIEFNKRTKAEIVNVYF